MDSPEPDIAPLDYHTPPKPLSAMRTVDLALARQCRAWAIVSLAAGLMILLGYWVTLHPVFLGLGMCWLLFGAMISITTLLLAVIQLATIRSHHINAAAGRRIYLWTLLVALLSFPAAVASVVIGARLADAAGAFTNISGPRSHTGFHAIAGSAEFTQTGGTS